MHEGGFFYQALIYLAAAVISVPIAKKLGLGSVLGYLIAGMIIGPFGLGLIGEEGQDVMHFAEFGVVMMLFLIGLELQPELLWKMRVPILGLGGTQVVVSTILIMGIALSIGLSWQVSLAIGMTLALSSTAIVLQTLSEKGLLKTHGGQNCFSVLLFQDIAFIPMLALLPLLATPEFINTTNTIANEHSTLIGNLPVWLQTIVVLSAILLIIVVGKYLMNTAFRIIASTKLREIFTASALLIVVGIAILMSQLGLSPALGTFIAGVVLAGNEYRHELESDIEPFKGLLLGLFFIAIGVSIDFNLIAGNPGLIAILVFGLIVVKMIVLYLIGKFYGMSFSNKTLFTFTLAQGGEFAFVLFSFSMQNGVLNAEIGNLLIASVAVTMALTPLLIIFNEKVFSNKENTGEEKLSDKIEEKNPVIIAGFGKFGSIIGRFLRANGVETTVLDTDPDKIEILRNLGLKVFYGDASRVELMHSARAEEASLLIIAIDEEDKILQILENVKKHFPKLQVLVKATNRRNAYEVIDRGFEDVYLEPMDSSLNIGIQALKKLGFRSHQAVRAANKFKKYETDSVFELAKMRNDKTKYIQSARELINYLENLLLKDVNYKDEFKDVGWDKQSLMDEFRNT